MAKRIWNPFEENEAPRPAGEGDLQAPGDIPGKVHTHALPSLRLRRLATAVILPAILLIVYLADRGSLPPLIYRLYAFEYGDKLGHFLLMGLLAFAMNGIFPKALALKGLPSLITGSAIAILFVILEEISQLFFSTRSFSLADLGCSLLGILSADLLVRRQRRRQEVLAAEQSTGEPGRLK